MQIGGIRHKALERFFLTGNPRGLDGRIVDRVRRMFVFLTAASDMTVVRVPPNYGAHELTGERAGTWSLTVTRNWRMTFTLTEDGAIVDLDLEDYH